MIASPIPFYSPRAPAGPSPTNMATKRPHAAMNAKDEEDDDPVDPSDELIFLALGGGNEVGRSCHIIQYIRRTMDLRRSLSMMSLILVPLMCFWLRSK